MLNMTNILKKLEKHPKKEKFISLMEYLFEQQKEGRLENILTSSQAFVDDCHELKDIMINKKYDKKNQKQKVQFPLQHGDGDVSKMG